MEIVYHAAVRSDAENVDLPEACAIRISMATAQEIVRLSQLVEQEKLFKVERLERLAQFIKHDPNENLEEAIAAGHDNLCSTDADCLNVSATEWWVSAYLKDSDAQVLSSRFSVAELKVDFGLDGHPVADSDGAAVAEVFQGMFSHEGIWLDLNFQVPQGASQKEKDAAFLAALAQQAEINYLSIGLTPGEPSAPAGNLQMGIDEEAERICARLVDSEEHAVEAAVPEIAFEAADTIRRLLGIVATQTRFVDQVAGMSIWEYDRDDGTLYQECAEPGDGFLDSHCSLMALIEEARKLKGGC